MDSSHPACRAGLCLPGVDPSISARQGYAPQVSLFDSRELSTMTVDDAHAIHNYLVYLEFPKVFSTATKFALFKAGSSLRPLTIF